MTSSRTDEAEQALCDQYDRQIRVYYEEAREKARAVRQVFEENLIGKLLRNLRDALKLKTRINRLNNI